MTVVNGKRMIYQFNDFGNVVSVRDELGYASYSKFSEALLPNHPEQVSKLQRSVINLLPNHDFELVGYWNTALNDGEGSFAYVTDQKYLGLPIHANDENNADGNLCVYMSYSNLEIGKAYTLSGYILQLRQCAGLRHCAASEQLVQQRAAHAWQRVDARGCFLYRGFDQRDAVLCDDGYRHALGRLCPARGGFCPQPLQPAAQL